ncbi:hypothetical protein [Isobaculum melis]|uniref:Uncharacterized protein n=1 Tax=Isobaculum melis TaxID=142588 RepID=A0A1H9UA56_9LACT|nr:hypothetical protein [Isobaculum melis]SES06336.1 hypothetical protein SAMN04488559_1258 [Isobaculum melis]
MGANILMILSGVSLVACAIPLTYQMYQLLLLDAKSKGLEKPKLWAVIGASGGRGEGLLLYLLKRKNYSGEVLEVEQQKKYQLKKRLTILLLIQLISALFFLLGLFL